MTTAEATLHLSLLGMYADNALRETENEQLEQLMQQLGLGEDTTSRAHILALAFAKVRGLAGDEEKVAAFLQKELNPALGTAEAKAAAVETLRQILNADSQVSTGENSILRLAEWMLK